MQLTIDFFYCFCFLFMYILSFVFIYQKFSEIIAFMLLFIVHTTFFIYVGKDIFKYLTNGYYFIPMFTSFSVISTVTLQFVSLVFILQLIITLRKKYAIDRGTPIYLPDKYQNKLDAFKAITVTLFVLIFILLCILTYGIRYLDVNFYDIITSLSINSFIKNILIFIVLILGLTSIGLSGYQVYLGNDLSKAQYTQIVSKYLQK